MEHSEHKQRQRVILDDTLQILRCNPSVLGVALSGSYARGEEDAFSDIDVVCYLAGEAMTGREELYQAVARVAPLLCDLWVYDVHALFLFENGVRLDLDFHPISSLKKHAWIAKCKIIHDPAGLLTQAARESCFQVEEAQKPFESVEWCFWMFRQIVCWAKRGEQGDIRDYDKLSSAVDSLSQVRSYLQRMRLWTLGHRDYLRRVDSLMAENLAMTYPKLVPADIIRCTRALLQEYERICPEYCKKSEIEYPGGKVQIIKRLIDEFDSIR